MAAALAVCMLSAGFVVASVTGNDGPPGALDAIADQHKVSGDRPANTTIRLATTQFDPLERVPEIDDALTAKRPTHWLVQVHAPASKSDRDAITAAGATILGYLPDMTYLVAADGATSTRMRDLAAVRWVGPYHPRYKISPSIDTSKFEQGQLRVYAHRNADPAAVGRSLERIGGVKVVEVGRRIVLVETAKARIDAIARVEGVEWVEPRPRYKLHNQNALWVNDTGMRNELGVALPGRLDGAGQTAAVADTGINYIPDPNGRAQQAFSDCSSATTCKLASYVQTVPGNEPEALDSVAPTGSGHRKMAGYFNLDADDPLPRSLEGSWHGTHVSGSVAADYPTADGVYGTRSRESDGIAPAARLTFQDIEADGGLGGSPADAYDLYEQVYDLNKNGQYDPLEDARTHNNSYGVIVPEADLFGDSMRTDDFIYEHPDMVVVFSASNDGPDAATLAGGPQVSKNTITSCASANGSQPLVAPDAAAIFSSHGPTLDGRIKPDVCTPGQIIVSPKGGTTDADHYLQGTSMSGPILVGLTTLVRQYFWDGFGPTGGTGYADGARNLNDRHNPSAALVKAATINSAQRMRGWYTGDRGGERADDGQWPSNGQGFGKVELDKSLYFAGDDRSLFTVDAPNTPERGLETGLEVTEFIDVAPGQPLDVTLTWTDPSNPLSVGSPVITNDLDLVVTAPDGTEYVGNEFTTQSPTLGPGGDASAEVGESVPGGAPDTTNTVEGVRLQTPAPGRYAVRVAGANVAQGPQGYALVVSGRLATDSSRVVFDAPKYQPGAEATAYLLGTGLPDEVEGFAKLGPSVFERTLTASGSGVTVTGGGVTGTAPVDSTAPTITAPTIESVSADLVRIAWSTDEVSTGAVVVSDADGNEVDYPDVHVRDGLEGLDTPQNETKGVYLDRPVVSRNHIVTVTGLDSATQYSYRIDATDEAGNSGTVNAGTFTTTGAVFAPNAPDIAMLISGDLTTGGPNPNPQQWGTSTQLYAGNFQPTVASLEPILDPTPIGRVEAMPAFMFRMPENLDPARITGAAVQLSSGHDIVNVYQDPTVYSMDLLDSSVEADWGPGKSYESVRNAPADTHLAPDMTDRRGANTPYSWHVVCNEIEALKTNLSEDGDGERRAAFRLRGIVDAPESLFSFETGYGRRSRGPHLRPKLVLFLDGHDPQPCVNTPAPRIEGVLVDHVPNAEGEDDSAVVSWRTDVPSDSTVYYRKVGSPDWIPVSAPARVTQHFVRIGNLEPNGHYEFVVRSANCNGLATTADNGGKAYALFNEAFEPPRISTLHAFQSPEDPTAHVVKWSTNQLSSSTVRYGRSPTGLDQSVTAPDDAEPTAAHELVLEGLDPCTRYYFVVESTNAAGKSATSEVLAFDRPPADLTAVTTFDFEAGDQGWVSTPPGGSGKLGTVAGDVTDNPTVWERRAEPATGGSQAWRTVIESTGTPGYSSSVDIRLVSPPITLPPDEPYLRFVEWFTLEPGDFEQPEVEFSLDDGGSWIKLRAGEATVNPDWPDPSTTTFAFPDEAAGESVRVGFHFRSDTNTEVVADGGWAVDDVQIMTGVCDQIAGVVSGIDLAPEKPPADEAPITSSGVSGPVPPVAGVSAAGNFLSLDAPTAEALAAGTCRCGPITYEGATGPAPPPPVPRPAPEAAPAEEGRGSLPATGGTTALWSFAVLGLALVGRRVSAGRSARGR